MQNGSKQASNSHPAHNKLDSFSLLLGIAGILFFILGQTSGYLQDQGPMIGYESLGDKIRTLLPFLSIICGILAIILGRISHSQNKKTNELPKNKTAGMGIIFGTLTLIPFCLFIVGILLWGLATK